MERSTRLTRRLAAAASVALLLGGGPLLLAGCEREGPGEELGENIDRSAEEARRALDPAGPAERAGEELDRAAEDAD
ncbi:MAG: hypothetical protein AB1671_22655 [Thermodesulfobacteriota bacterium]|jgi:hypothetical protein